LLRALVYGLEKWEKPEIPAIDSRHVRDFRVFLACLLLKYYDQVKQCAVPPLSRLALRGAHSASQGEAAKQKKYHFLLVFTMFSITILYCVF